MGRIHEPMNEAKTYSCKKSWLLPWRAELKLWMFNLQIRLLQAGFPGKQTLRRRFEFWKFNEKGSQEHHLGWNQGCRSAVTLYNTL